MTGGCCRESRHVCRSKCHLLATMLQYNHEATTHRISTSANTSTTIQLGPLHDTVYKHSFSLSWRVDGTRKRRMPVVVRGDIVAVIRCRPLNLKLAGHRKASQGIVIAAPTDKRRGLTSTVHCTVTWVAL